MKHRLKRQAVKRQEDLVESWSNPAGERMAGCGREGWAGDVED